MSFYDALVHRQLRLTPPPLPVPSGVIILNNYGRCRIILPLYFLSVEAVLLIKVIGSRRASSLCSGRYLIPQNSPDPPIGIIHPKGQGPRQISIVDPTNGPIWMAMGMRGVDQIPPFQAAILAHCIRRFSVRTRQSILLAPADQRSGRLERTIGWVTIPWQTLVPISLQRCRAILLCKSK